MQFDIDLYKWIRKSKNDEENNLMKQRLEKKTAKTWNHIGDLKVKSKEQLV